MLERFNDTFPSVDETAFVHPLAYVSGRVTLGKDVFILPFASLRGDINYIAIGEGSNVQDGAVLHVTDTLPVLVGNYVTVGHGAILHGCTVGNNCIIGMGAVVLDGAEIGDNVLVAAGTLIPPRKKIPSGVLVVGNPFKIVRELTQDEISGIMRNALDYIELKNVYKNGGQNQ